MSRVEKRSSLNSNNGAKTYRSVEGSVCECKVLRLRAFEDDFSVVGPSLLDILIGQRES